MTQCDYCEQQATRSGTGEEARHFCDYHNGFLTGAWRVLEFGCGLHWLDAEELADYLMRNPNGYLTLKQKIIAKTESDITKHDSA